MSHTLSGLIIGGITPQGVALGWYVMPFQGKSEASGLSAKCLPMQPVAPVTNIVFCWGISGMASQFQLFRIMGEVVPGVFTTIFTIPLLL